VAGDRHDRLKTDVVRLAGIEPTTLGFGEQISSRGSPREKT